MERQRHTNPYRSTTSRYGSSHMSYTIDSKSLNKGVSSNFIDKGTIAMDVKGERNVTEKGNVVHNIENKRDAAGTSGGKSC